MDSEREVRQLSEYRLKEHESKGSKLKLILILSTLILVFIVSVLMSPALADDPGTDEGVGDGISSVDEEEQDPEVIRLNALKDRFKYSKNYSDELFDWTEENKEKFEDYYTVYTEAILEMEEGKNLEIIDEFLLTLSDFQKISGEDRIYQDEVPVNALGYVDVASAVSIYDQKMQDRYSGDEQLVETAMPEDLDEILRSGGLVAEAVPNLESSYKNILPDERFRHYTVELAIKPIGPEIDPESLLPGQDIVLMIDTSQSMSGSLPLEQTHSTKMDAVKASAKWFVRNSFLKNPSNRVGIVQFSGEAKTVCELMDAQQEDEILRRIDELFAGGETNTQAGIIEAKKVLDVEDAVDVSGSERKKNIMILSDGVATVHYSDNVPELSAQSFKGYPEKDTKRWGYGGFENHTIIKTVFFDEPTSSRTEKAKRLAILESQYAVRQGIEIYTVDFSGGDAETTEFLEQMTYSMIEDPKNIPEEHLYPTAYNPSYNEMFTDQQYQNRYFIVDSPERLEGSVETIIGKVLDPKFGFNITDSIDLEKFEIVDYPKTSHKSDTVKAENSFIHWNINGSSDSLRTVTYTVRLRDEQLFEDGTGIYSPGGDFAGNPDFNLKVEIGNRTTLSYKDSENRESAFPYMIPTISIQPLVKGEAYAENMSGEVAEAFITGDHAYLAGKILGGSGNFAYQWYEGDDALSDAPIDIKGDIKKDLIYPLEDSTQEFKTFKLDKSGELAYTLRLIDRGAEKAGYTAENVAYVDIPVTIEVLEAKLTVEIVGDIGGFETTVFKYLGDDHDSPEKWFLSGTGTQVYDNIGSGDYKIHTYVPYGYTALVGKSDGVTLDGNAATFQIKPVKTSGGKWQVTSPKVTIKIVRTKDAPNFFDWSWGANESLVED